MDAAAAAAARSTLMALSHQLMQQFSAANGATNLVFSPLSIYSALSQIATSARGSTLRELLDVVGVRCSKELAQNAGYMVQRARSGGPHCGGPMVTYGLALWHDTTLTPKPDYRKAANSLTGVVGGVNFLSKPEEARNHINWVMGLPILPAKSVDQDTRLVHTSAAGLKGNWEMPFYRWRNKEHKFHRLDGGAVDATFMHINEHQLVATHDGFKVLKMPYTVSDPFHGVPTWELTALMLDKRLPLPPPTRYSMCIFLPDEPDGLWSLQEKMASSSPGFLHEHLPEKRVHVGEFRVPKFNLSFATSVKRILQYLGIKSAFSTRADLRGMLDDHGSARQPLFLSDIQHEADIEMDEDGTQPAAYTACAMCGACLWPERRTGCVDFVADHPFAFFVMEEVSGVVLLAGHVIDPTQGQPSTSSL